MPKTNLKFIIVALTILIIGSATQAKADKVTDWNAVASQVLLNTGRGNANGVIDMAYVHIAIYDAVNAIDGEPYSVFAVRPTSVPPGASAEAATPNAIKSASNVVRIHASPVCAPLPLPRVLSY